jgi:hypothetical protein
MSNDPWHLPIIQLSAEAAEIVADVISSETVAAIPVVGTAFSVVRAMDAIRERILQQKLLAFLKEPSLAKAAEARRLRNAIYQDEEKAAQIGTTLLLVLDKVTDLKKPELLGKVYAAYLSDEIDAESVLRLAHAIDMAATWDLVTFIEAPTTQGFLTDDWAQRLSSTGLMKASPSGAIGAPNLYFKNSALGNMLLRAVKYVNSI